MLNLLRNNRSKFASLLLLFLALNLFECVLAVSNGKKLKNGSPKSEQLQPLDSDEQRSVYCAIAEMHLPSLSSIETEELEKLQTIKDENEKALREKNGKPLTIPSIGEVEKLRLVYQLFDADSVQKKDLLPNKRAVLSTSVFKDLEMYCGSVENLEHNLFAQIDNTKTTFGKVALQNFMYPRYDKVQNLKQEINRKTSIVKYLVEHEEVFNKIDEHLDIIKSSENDMVWFWKEMDDIIKAHFDSIYFKKFGSQESTLVQGLSAEYTRTINPTLWVTGSWFVLAYILWGMGTGMISLPWAADKINKIKYIFKDAGRILKDNYYPYGCPTAKYAYLAATNCSPSQINHLIDQMVDQQNKEIDKQIADIRAKIERKRINPVRGESVIEILNNSKFTKKTVTVTGAIVGSILLAVTTTLLYYIFWRPAGRSIINLNKISKQMQEKMINVSSINRSAIELGDIIKFDSTMSELFPKFNDLQVNPGAEVNDLSDILTKDTFKGQPSFWSNKGRVIASFKKMFRLKDGFVGKLKAIGEIDALMSIAKLYKKHMNNTNAKYCFAQIVEANKPYINLQEVWHPYLDPQKAVTNNIELGSVESGNNMILTGPNASGKSVYLRKLAIALIFATSFGIAPASVCKFTPFPRIATYLNVADTVGKESLFQAELRKAGELLELGKNLNTDEFMFVDVDEPFTGTNPDEGKKAAYNFARGFNSQCICVFATHYKELADLEVETNGFFRNYKVCVELCEDGTFKRTYKVTPGIGEQQIATAMAQQALGQYFTKTDSAAVTIK